MMKTTTEKSASHSPSPWEFVPRLTPSENHAGFFILAELPQLLNGKWALATVQPGDEDGNLGKANARVIAAAPELLEACKRSMREIQNCGDRDLVEFVEAAIAKAEGK